MPNHFHLVFFQHNEFAIRDLMRSIGTSYAMYFNQRNNRVGHLFQGIYKASLIDKEDYLWHISRYIHLNPADLAGGYLNYPYSSYDYLVGKKTAAWIKPRRILDLHEEYRSDYSEFVSDFDNSKKTLEELKPLLADQ